jgi:hypothetical protein
VGRSRENVDVKIAGEITLIDSEGFSASTACQQALSEIRAAIHGVHWPSGSQNFTIFPESGKKSGQGNGVVAIRQAFVVNLAAVGWQAESPFPSLVTEPDGARFGAMDASKVFGAELPFLAEWETGNISSSHRALNKMAIGLMRRVISGAVLIVPTRELAQYLTDRIGNLRELIPYLDLWRAVPVERGFLGIFAIEHDAISMTVERIKKGTDGRALR